MKTLLQTIQKNRLYYKNRIEEILKEWPVAHLNVLDLGCGEMLLREYVRSRNCLYTGVDQLYFGQKENFISSDILNFDFRGGPFDIIFLLGVIDHMPFREKELVLERVQDHFSKTLVMSQFNSGNILFRFLFPDQKPIEPEHYYKAYRIRKLALLKFPFFQRVFRLNVNGAWTQYLASEFVYMITKENE